MKMRLRELREDHDLKQKDHVEYLHIWQNTYSQHENGQRQIPLEVLIALLKYYRTSTDYLLCLASESLTDYKNRLSANLPITGFLPYRLFFA